MKLGGSDPSAFKRDINELLAYTSRKIIENELEQSEMFNAVISLLSLSASREISEREAKLINRLGYYKEMRSGMKRSRVINTVFKEYPIGDDHKIDATKFTDGHEEGDRNYLSYNKLFAKAADDTNPLKIKRITVLSVNICDFLLMSNGNSWSSCHFINRSGAYQGCYKAGTLSYSNDGTSMCFYTLPETYGGIWKRKSYDNYSFMKTVCFCSLASTRRAAMRRAKAMEIIERLYRIL